MKHASCLQDFEIASNELCEYNATHCRYERCLISCRKVMFSVVCDRLSVQRWDPTIHDPGIGRPLCTKPQPHCIWPWSLTYLNLFNLDLTVQNPPPTDMFKLVNY